MQNIGHASPQAWPSVIASCTSGMCLHMLPVEMMASTLKQTLFFFASYIRVMATMPNSEGRS